MGLSPITFSEIVRGPDQPHEKTNKASGEGGRACIFFLEYAIELHIIALR
jgi:hypothetical protein